MPAQSAKIQPYVTQHAECACKPVTRVALLQKSGDVSPPFLEQRLLDGIANADDPTAITLREIEFLELGIQSDEGGPDPVIEGFRSRSHTN
jgi:hypothetical protein